MAGCPFCSRGLWKLFKIAYIFVDVGTRRVRPSLPANEGDSVNATRKIPRQRHQSLRRTLMSVLMSIMHMASGYGGIHCHPDACTSLDLSQVVSQVLS